jgi:tripartite-type tricarboxylate transporter receptor subunit TctC
LAANLRFKYCSWEGQSWSCAAVLLSPLASTGASAQSGTIRLVIGTAPGGAIDPYARMIAEHMQKTLGQTIIIENKPGASGALAAQYIVDQPADGSILWLGTQAFTEIVPNMFPNARWTIDQFDAIIRGVEAPLAFVINPTVPANNFAEFIKWAKDNKGKLSYCS